jgi:hypothetical protein
MLFKRKEKVNPDEQKEIILTEYINELKRLGFSNKQIKDKFIEKKYPNEFIDYLLKNTKEVKPMSEEEYDEDFEEEQEDEEEEEPETTPVKPVKKKEKEVKKAELTLEGVANAVQVLAQEVEKRLQAIEASLYRIRNA